MDITDLFWDLAVILLFTKLFGMLMRKLGMPQVVGMVIAGLLIGPAIWGQFGWWSPVNPTGSEKDFIDGVAEIGVVLILFSAGLETDVKELKRSGLVSTLIAAGGVIVPMGFGFLIAVPFLGGFSALGNSHVLLDAVVVGVILAFVYGYGGMFAAGSMTLSNIYPITASMGLIQYRSYDAAVHWNTGLCILSMVVVLIISAVIVFTTKNVSTAKVVKKAKKTAPKKGW